METKFLFSGICYSNLPKPESEGRTLSEVSECENIPITDLDSGDACKCYSFLQLIHHGMSLLYMELGLSRLPVEDKFVPAAQQIFHSSVENQSILLAMGTSIALALYYSRIASGSPFCEFEAYTVPSLIKDEYISSSMDLNGGFSNKDFKSATTGFYSKDERTVFQKIKYMKCSKGGRAENIGPGRIRRQRSRRKKKGKDDEKDGEDNGRSSDSNFLSLIMLTVLLLMVLLIVLSLIVWLMS